MERLGTTLLLLTAISAAGFAQDLPIQASGVTAGQKARISKELDAALAGWSGARNAKDAAGVAEFYDANADVIYEDNIHLRGRQTLKNKQKPNSRKSPTGEPASPTSSGPLCRPRP